MSLNNFSNILSYGEFYDKHNKFGDSHSLPDHNVLLYERPYSDNCKTQSKIVLCSSMATIVTWWVGSRKWCELAATQ